ncbi:cytochrome P450 [Calocera cornea HHB12733]|uniref:Cytochrome P450 n=1 Tax=Calocera cornea HHB12733 TaxID=1353952 RepID=A0A165EWL0_9BASI|nr:cytochrome P450 [Calocera cornea HHB12733]
MSLSVLALALALAVPLDRLVLPLLPTLLPVLAQLPHLARLTLHTLTLYSLLALALDSYNRPANPNGYRILRYHDLPGPWPTSLVWGLEKALYDDAPPGKLLDAWSAKYGGAYRFRGVLGAKNITLTLPSALHHVLTTSVYTYPKPLGGRLWLGTLLGEGVLVSEGEKHAGQRKRMARAFTPQALRGMHEVFEQCTGKVVDAWEALLTPTAAGKAATPAQDDAAGGKALSIDVQYWANRLSLDAIGLAGFGYPFGSLDSAVDGSEQHPLATTFDKLTDSSGTYAAFVLRAVLFVWPGVLKMPSKRTKSIGEVRKKLGAEVKRVRQESGSLAGRTVIGILEQQAAEEGSGIDDDEIEAQIMTLVFAGYETTSCAISWALYELALHPASQAALRDELRASASASQPGSGPQPHPPLLDAVIRETLRLHPPVLDLHREAETDDLVPLGDGRALWVDKGTVVYIPLNVLGNEGHPGPWNPEQWLKPAASAISGSTGSAGSGGSSTSTVWAFSDGPRVCIGRAFAMSEIRTVLSALVSGFEFAPDPALEVEPFVSFVVRPKVRGDRRSTLPLLVRKAA